MTLILGIDPGSRITGYGVVRDTGRGCEYVASGCIRTGEGALPERLQKVYRGVREVILASQPNKRFVESQAIGDIVLFLCSPAADAITGIALPVEGGWTAR